MKLLQPINDVAEIIPMIKRNKTDIKIRQQVNLSNVLR